MSIPTRVYNCNEYW